VSLDLDPETFWRKTPREISIIMAGRGDALARQHNERAWLAWHIAALPRAKKFPKLEKMMVKAGPVKRVRQTPEQMLMIAKAMAGMSFPEIKH
jgi:hypothetical protein